MLWTVITEPRTPNWYVLEATHLLAELLLKQFRRSLVPLEKAAALKELRDMRAKLVATIPDFVLRHLRRRYRWR